MGENVAANYPITWVEAQSLLSQFGYALSSKDTANCCATFRLTGEGRTEGLKNPITIKFPDFVSTDGETPAYERDYIVDLLTQITGGNGSKPVATFLALRRTN